MPLQQQQVQQIPQQQSQVNVQPVNQQQQVLLEQVPQQSQVHVEPIPQHAPAQPQPLPVQQVQQNLPQIVPQGSVVNQPQSPSQQQAQQLSPVQVANLQPVQGVSNVASQVKQQSSSGPQPPQKMGDRPRFDNVKSGNVSTLQQPTKDSKNQKPAGKVDELGDNSNKVEI